MFIVRAVVTCKPGKVRELVEKFKSLGAVMKEMGVEPYRIYTDVAGERFWTLVLEHEYQSLDAIAATESKVMGDDRAKSVMAGYHDLVVEGRRETYKAAS